MMTNTDIRLRRAILMVVALAALITSLGPMASVAQAWETDGWDQCNNPDTGCDDCPCPDEGQTADGGMGPTKSTHPVHFSLNSAVEQAVDLVLPGQALTWSHTRTYDSRMSREEGSFVGMAGARWMGGEVGSYLRYPHGDISKLDIELYFTATSKRTFKYDATNGGYTAPVDTPLTMVKSGSDATVIFTVTNTETGAVTEYYGLNLSISRRNRGKLKYRTSRTLQAANERGIRYFYNSSGMLAQVVTSQGWEVVYDYYDTGPTGYLKSVSVYDGSQATGTLLQRAEYRYFGYDLSGQATNDVSSVGNAGDLVQVQVFKRASNDTGTTLSIVRTTQYRYFSNQGSNSGLSQLKMVLEPDAVERLVQDFNLSEPDDILGLDDTDHTGASGKNLEDFASRSFTYYYNNSPVVDTSWPGTESGADLVGKYGGALYGGEVSESFMQWDLIMWDGAVESETINGSCATCSGGGGGAGGGIKKEYYYIELADWYGEPESVPPVPPVGIDEPNQVVRIVIEDTVDAGGTARYRRLYGINYRGAAIREAFIENPLSPSANNIWCTSIKLGNEGAPDGDDWRVVERRMPSAHKWNASTSAGVKDNDTLKQFLNPYDPDGMTPSAKWANDTATVNSGSGVVYHYEYDQTTGKRPTGVLVSKGTSGTKHYIAATDYAANATGYYADGDGSGQAEAEEKLPVARYVYPEQKTTSQRGDGIKTTISYTFWDDTGGTGEPTDTSIKSITTTLPVIGDGTGGSEDQNGSGVATTAERYFDKLGRLRWTKDGEGYVNYYSYHPDTGGLAYVAIDVDPTSAPAGATGNDTKWVSWNDDGSGSGYASSGKPSRGSGLPTALALVTTHEFDDQGRPVKKVGPREQGTNIAHYRTYQNNYVARYPYWDTSATKSLMPIQVEMLNDAGEVIESFDLQGDSSNVSKSSSTPVGITGTLDQSEFTSWTRIFRNQVNGQMIKVLRYHIIPDTGDGSPLTNYYVTAFDYDSLGRRTTTVQTVQSTSGYQDDIRKIVYDDLDRVVETLRDAGNSSVDTGPDADWSALSLGGLETVSETTYDSGGVGDGHVTKETRNFGTGSYDFTGTNYYRNFRGQLRLAEPFYMNGTTEMPRTPQQVTDVDWMGRTIAEAQYADELSGSTVVADDNYAATEDADRHDLEKTHFDDLGRVFRSERYPGTESDKHFEVNNYYDRNGRLVCTGDKYGAHTEYAYDGAGRKYQTRTVKDVAATPYTSGKFNYRLPAPNPQIRLMSSGNQDVIELSHQEYWDNSGMSPVATTDVLEEHTFELNHDDTNGLNLNTSGVPTDGVRASRYNWYDAADRLATTVDYGSDDGSDSGTTDNVWTSKGYPTRGSNAPTSSDAARLVTKYAYSSTSGRRETVTDPADVATKTFYDDLGGRLFVVENHQGTYDPTIGSVTAGQNRTTGWAYNGLDNVTVLTAYNSGSTTKQITKFEYTDNYDASLIAKIYYPDEVKQNGDLETWATGVTFEYNIDGSLKKRSDQRGTEIDYTYTTKRRQLEYEKASSLGGSTDPSIRAIKREYDLSGRLKYVTSYDSATSFGSGNIKNQVQLHYGTHGQVTQSDQDHYDGITSGTNHQSVQYAYDSSVDNGTDNIYDNSVRLQTVTYPGASRAVESKYGSANGIDDRLSRLHQLENDGTSTLLTQYAYNGTGRLVETDYLIPDVRRRMFDIGGAGTNNYNGFDRFGRTLFQHWYKYSTPTAYLDAWDYTYDEASNQLTRDLNTALVSGASNEIDQKFTYDGLHRLKNFDQGTLSGGSISSPKKEEDFTLDQLGNWSGYVKKTNGSPVLNQTRYHNSVNEIDTDNTDGDADLSITGSPNWADPVYDAAGNMTEGPKPGGETSKHKYIYDAWNRLVKVTDASNNTIQSNEFDGLGRRIVKGVYINGSLIYNLHQYYNYDWQLLEERIELNGTEYPNPFNQFLWHPYYIDALAVRWYDSSFNGSAIVDYYYLHDANYSVTGVVNSSAAVKERYHYSPYGGTTITSAGFGTIPASTIGNTHFFTGREQDSDTGLQLNRNRFYASHLGRWLTRDPIGYFVGANLYTYVRSVPTRYVDPSGLHYVPEPPGGPHPKIPGGPWKWCPDPQNPRGGTWRPTNPPPKQSPPTVSWDPQGHWDYDDGLGNPRIRYDEDGNPFEPPGHNIPPDTYKLFQDPVTWPAEPKLAPRPQPTPPYQIPWREIGIGIGIGIGIATPLPGDEFALPVLIKIGTGA